MPNINLLFLIVVPMMNQSLGMLVSVSLLLLPNIIFAGSHMLHFKKHFLMQ